MWMDVVYWCRRRCTNDPTVGSSTAIATAIATRIRTVKWTRIGRLFLESAVGWLGGRSCCSHRHLVLIHGRRVLICRRRLFAVQTRRWWTPLCPSCRCCRCCRIWWCQIHLVHFGFDLIDVVGRGGRRGQRACLLSVAKSQAVVRMESTGGWCCWWRRFFRQRLKSWTNEECVREWRFATADVFLRRRWIIWCRRRLLQGPLKGQLKTGGCCSNCWNIFATLRFSGKIIAIGHWRRARRGRRFIVVVVVVADDEFVLAKILGWIVAAEIMRR